MHLLKINDYKSLEKIKEYYIQDFPKKERISFKKLQKLIQKNKLDLIFFINENLLIGYMITAKSKNNYILIEYFAILKQYRNLGYGSICLQLCQNFYKSYKGIFLEAEHRNSAKNLTEKVTRQKRISFYEKNNFKHINVTFILYGISFEILLYSNFSCSPREIIYAAKNIYYNLSNPFLVKLHCKFKIV